MLNKAMMLAKVEKKGEPTLTVKWNTFQETDDFAVSLCLCKLDGEKEVIGLSGIDGSEGLSFPISILEEAYPDGHFFVSNSKVSYGVNYLSVVTAENVTYDENISGYDDYIYCTIESLDKDALFEFEIS